MGISSAPLKSRELKFGGFADINEDEFLAGVGAPFYLLNADLERQSWLQAFHFNLEAPTSCENNGHYSSRRLPK